MKCVVCGNDAGELHNHCLRCVYKNKIAIAVEPFTETEYGLVKDAEGDDVVTCNEHDEYCSKRYKGRVIDRHPHFICDCGRLGQRMEELDADRIKVPQ